MVITKFTKNGEVNPDLLGGEIMAAAPSVTDVDLVGFALKKGSNRRRIPKGRVLRKEHEIIKDQSSDGELRCTSEQELTVAETAAVTKALRDHVSTVNSAKQQKVLDNREDREQLRTLAGASTNPLAKATAKGTLRWLDKQDRL